jgi:hypothetical protein
LTSDEEDITGLRPFFPFLCEDDCDEEAEDDEEEEEATTAVDADAAGTDANDVDDALSSHDEGLFDEGAVNLEEEEEELELTCVDDVNAAEDEGAEDEFCLAEESSAPPPLFTLFSQDGALIGLNAGIVFTIFLFCKDIIF